jgi:hypothetical protein
MISVILHRTMLLGWCATWLVTKLSQVGSLKSNS